MGYTDCTQDAEVAFSPYGSSSTHYLCSEKANPKNEVAVTTRANSEKLLAGGKKLLSGP